MDSRRKTQHVNCHCWNNILLTLFTRPNEPCSSYAPFIYLTNLHRCYFRCDYDYLPKLEHSKFAPNNSNIIGAIKLTFQKTLSTLSSIIVICSSVNIWKLKCVNHYWGKYSYITALQFSNSGKIHAFLRNVNVYSLPTFKLSNHHFTNISNLWKDIDIIAIKFANNFNKFEIK